ncbi:MAG: geranylgeranyl reductase family protein [Gaiellaceae bacterium]
MQRFDAVVVGAGPAGSTTACRLASGGASVLLLDKQRFPRDKPCGGGLTLRAVRQLPFSVEPVVEDVVDRFELRLGYRHAFERASAEPLCFMTQRRRLDDFLARTAADAGADFRDGVSVSLGAGGELVVDGEPVEADVIVGADGVNGATARAFGLGRDHGHGVALEGNAPLDERYRGRLVLELGVVPGGYGWVFPKGDHVNFGVGGWESEGPRLREHLRRLCDVHGADFDALTELRGYRLPFRRPASPFACNRLLLVGDAAGLIDPLSGDGMYEAFVSGRLAAEAILAGDLVPYQQRVLAELAPLHAASWTAKYALDRFPRLTFAIARAPLAWSVIARIVRGDLRDPTAARGLSRAPLKALDRLGRLAQPV